MNNCEYMYMIIYSCVGFISLYNQVMLIERSKILVCETKDQIVNLRGFILHS